MAALRALQSGHPGDAFGGGGVRGRRGRRPSSCCMAAPRVVANASSTGLSATRWRSTQPFGPTAVSAVANAAARPVSPTTSVCAAWASSSSWLRSAGETGDSVRPSSVNLLGDLPCHFPFMGPVDCRIRITCDRSTCDRSKVAGSKLPPNKLAESPEPVSVRALRRALRGLQVETGRPRGQCMGVHSVAVTGASGLVGRHLLPVLAAHPDVDRVPRPRRAGARTAPADGRFARAHIAGTELKPLLEGIDVVVHLAGVVHRARRRRRWRGSTSRAPVTCSTPPRPLAREWCASPAPPSTARG